MLCVSLFKLFRLHTGKKKPHIVFMLINIWLPHVAGRLCCSYAGLAPLRRNAKQIVNNSEDNNIMMPVTLDYVKSWTRGPL